MKRKIKITVALVIVALLIILPTLWLTNCFTKSKLTRKIYRPDNVYEEIWNLYVKEQFGGDTVLTTSKENSEAQYEFGQFMYIRIPDYSMIISWESRTLAFDFFTDDERILVKFLYDYETKTLYGEEEFEYFAENFLQHYLEWNKEETKYSLDNLGNVDFQYVEYANSIYSK